MRERVVHALGYLGPVAAPAVPALLARIEADDEALIPDVFGALGCIGPGAADALPVFTKWLRETWRDDVARADAAAGILRIAEPTPDVLETCSITLRDGSYEVMVRLLPASRPSVRRGASLAGDLRELIADETTHDWIRLHAIDTLGCIAPGRRRGRSRRFCNSSSTRLRRTTRGPPRSRRWFGSVPLTGEALPHGGDVRGGGTPVRGGRDHG